MLFKELPIQVRITAKHIAPLAFSAIASLIVFISSTDFPVIIKDACICVSVIAVYSSLIERCTQNKQWKIKEIAGIKIKREQRGDKLR